MSEKIRLSPKQRMVLRALSAGPRRWRTAVQACEAESWSLARRRALDRTALCLADHGLLDCLQGPGGERLFQATLAGRVALHSAVTRRRTSPPPTRAVRGKRGPVVAVDCCRHPDCQQLRAAQLMDEGDDLGALAIVEQDAAVFCCRSRR
jgi:hypothetical protein